MNETIAIHWPEAAIKHSQMLVFQTRCAFNGARGINVAHNLFHLRRTVAQLDQRLWNGIVHNLDHAAANQLLMLHQSQIRFNARGVAIHHEADGASGCNHRSLGIAIAMQFA